MANSMMFNPEVTYPDIPGALSKGLAMQGQLQQNQMQGMVLNKARQAEAERPKIELAMKYAPAAKMILAEYVNGKNAGIPEDQLMQKIQTMYAPIRDRYNAEGAPLGLKASDNWDPATGAQDARIDESMFKEIVTSPGKGKSSALGTKDTIEAGMALRKEFNALPVVKDYNQVNQQLGLMKGAIGESKKAGTMIAVDQALVTVYNKMLDPTSVVRESEYARTANDMAILNRFKGKIDKVSTGGAGLTSEERDALVRMAKIFADKYKKKYDWAKDHYSSIAKRSGLEVSDIIAPDFADAEPTPTTAAPVAPKGMKAKLPDGTVITSDGAGNWIPENGR